MSKLHVVGPVGAWQDLTLRAREVLCRARLVVVHEEKKARPHLDEIGARALLLESRRRDAIPSILSALGEGEVAWLVTRIDELAARPRMVQALLERGVEFISVPGASPMVGGLVASGLPADRFTALGLLPLSPDDRLALWPAFARDPITVVCEVRAETLGKVLGEVRRVLGERQIALCQGDDVWRGRLGEGPPPDWEGRLTLVIAGAGSEPDWPRERVLEEVRACLDAGASARDTARDVARRSGWHKRQVYELALSASRDED